MNNRIISPEKIERFKSSLLREEKSPVTIEKYIRDVEKFRSFAGERPCRPLFEGQDQTGAAAG